jgi:ectoine hydroxylase
MRRTATTMADIYPSRIHSQPRITPRQDPVVWRRARANAPCSETEIAHYEENGFLILPDLFDPSEVAVLRDAADAARARVASTIEPETVIIEPESQSVRSIFAIHRQDEQIGALMRDPRLTGLARFILDDEIYIHQSRLNYKPGLTGRGFWWHSDFETWHIEDGMPRMRALSVSLMLTDNLVSNGPLLLINGSHKHYVACVGETPPEHFKASLRKQEYGVPDHDSIAELAKRGIRAAVARAGSAVVFDCNVLHGSSGNITPFPRSNLFFVYNALTNRCVAPFSGQPPRPEHIATREHVTTL